MIPVPVDYEALAAAALAETPQTAAVEEQQPQEQKSARTIDFTCPFCDAELHLSADLGGKKEPCPECKRIIKVPMLVQERAKDWRTVEQKTGPSGALANAQQPQLEGVWDTTQKARVSTAALEEADAIIEEEEPVGVGGWIKRVVIVGGLAGVIVLAIVFITRRQSARTQADALSQALQTVEGKPDEKVDLSPAWRAEIYRAAGEFYINKGEPNKALTQFKKARGFPPQKGATPLDQDLMLMRIALSLVDLGGDAKQVEDEVRLEWKDVQKQLLNTLAAIGSPEVKTTAVRETSAKLLKLQQSGLALALVRQLSADTGSATQAHWLALAHDPTLPLQEKDRKEMLELTKKQVPPPNLTRALNDPVARAAYAEARAREGNYLEAATFVDAPGPAPERLHATLIVAAVAEEKKAAEAKQFLDKAYKFAAELKEPAPWLRLQTIRAAAQAGDLEKAKELIKTLPAGKTDYKSWALYEIFRAQLAQAQGEAGENLAPELLPSGPGKDSLARAIAWEELARHDIRYSSYMRQRVENVDEPSVRPLILLGIALGTQQN
jgi:hypothetical protein